MSRTSIEKPLRLGFKEELVALDGHPAGAVEVGVDHGPGPLRLAHRIDAEQFLGHVVNAGTLVVKIEETQVKREVLPVIIGDLVRHWDVVAIAWLGHA